MMHRVGKQTGHPWHIYILYHDIYVHVQLLSDDRYGTTTSANESRHKSIAIISKSRLQDRHYSFFGTPKLNGS